MQSVGDDRFIRFATFLGYVGRIRSRVRDCFLGISSRFSIVLFHTKLLGDSPYQVSRIMGSPTGSGTPFGAIVSISPDLPCI